MNDYFNSRLVVDDDNNDKFRFESVNENLTTFSLRNFAKLIVNAAPFFHNFSQMNE